MATDHLEEFTDSLGRHEATWTRVSAGALQSELATIVEPPAVGVELPYESVSLADLGVELDPTPTDLEAAATGVTPAGAGIAQYGSLVLASSTPTEPVSLFADRHVAVLDASDVVPDVAAALEELGPTFREAAESAVVATGPSATADMGGLVYGAHGPKDVHVLVVTDA
jgi:L-lactate dehydrogenase complex protein LldG